MSVKTTLLLTGMLFSCLLQAGAQKTYYVAPHGNDHQNGSIDAPLRSIRAALHLAVQDTGTVQVFLREGRYYLDTTITVKATKGKSLTISSYKNEQVWIDAGKPLRTNWRPYKNGIFVTKIAPGTEISGLYINQQKQIRARFPNWDDKARIMHGTSSEALSPARIRSWENPKNGYIHGLQVQQWGSLSYRITGKENDSTVKTVGGWQINRSAQLSDQYRFVENIFEELDSPKEWYYDTEKHLLYYFPPAGLDLNNAVVTASHLKESIVIKGDRAPVRGVSIQGISFTHNSPSFMETREPILRTDWCIYRGAAVRLENTAGCAITDCDFTDVDGNAIMISGQNEADTVYGCHIFWVGASAVSVIGMDDAVRSPRHGYSEQIAYQDLDKTPGPKSNNYPKNIFISNNLIHHIGQIEKQVAGVEIDIASQVTVSHNSIYHVPRSGINIGDGCFGGHILEYNDVFNTVLETGDHGAFNSWGRDRFWSSNPEYTDSLVREHPELITLDVQSPNILRYNRFRCDHGWDIDLDDGSSNYQIYGNVCLNGGLKLREGYYRRVTGNIMINNSFHPHVWYSHSSNVFKHNIVTAAYRPVRMDYWTDSIDYNLFPDSASLLSAQADGTDGHSLAGAPLFENAALGDYRVKEGSAALKIGFKNFDQDQFGVQLPHLKKIAEQPQIPILQAGWDTEQEDSKTFQLLGATVQNIRTLGQRSAFGLPDTAGVVIVQVGRGPLQKAGLQNGDVILSIAATTIKDVHQIIDLLSQNEHRKTLPLSIFRNQEQLDKTLQL